MDTNSNISPLIQHDIPLLSALQPVGWMDITPYFSFYIAAGYCFPIKVSEGNNIIGVGATILHGDTAWLGHIIVHPDHRGQGIGQTITTELMRISQTKGCSTIHLIATEMGFRLYEKLGFITVTDYLFFEDIQPEENLKINSVRSYQKTDREKLLMLDQSISAEDRAWQLENHLTKASIYTADGQMQGFYLPTMGEGLILASQPVAGIELLKLHLLHNQKVVLPKDNLPAIQFLMENGFNQTQAAKRMTYGKTRNIKFECIYNRIGGNLG